MLRTPWNVHQDSSNRCKTLSHLPLRTPDELSSEWTDMQHLASNQIGIATEEDDVTSQTIPDVAFGISEVSAVLSRRYCRYISSNRLLVVYQDTFLSVLTIVCSIITGWCESYPVFISESLHRSRCSPLCYEPRRHLSRSCNTDPRKQCRTRIIA